MLISEEAGQKAIIVPDGKYERFVSSTTEDDHSSGCHDCYAGCSGKCGVSGESCSYHIGRNKNGHFVGWCMCSNKSRSEELFRQGLVVAEAYLSPEAYEQYKANITSMLASE